MNVRETAFHSLLTICKDDGYSNKDIVKMLKNSFNISKNEAYELVLNLENEEEK